MYAEEADLCARARKLGARPSITPSSTIVHLGGRSEASQLEKTIKVARGRITLIRKHWRAAPKAVGIALFLWWSASRAGASLMLRRAESDKWRTIWKRRREWLRGYE
jgi:GT2 family glycosyltransferase